MKLTIKHFYDFQDVADNVGTSLDPNSWDMLRLSNPAQDDRFAIPDSISSWREKILTTSIWHERAKVILNLMQQRFYRLYSYGVGIGGVEFLIKKEAPQVFLECSDYAPKTVERLREVFKEADKISQFDMLKDEWVNEGSICLYLFHRIDTEFNDREWHIIFERAAKAGIQHILFVPSEFLTFRRFIRQKIKLFLYTLLRKKITFSGYLRTREQFKTFFQEHYEIESIYRIGDLKGFLLKRIN